MRFDGVAPGSVATAMLATAMLATAMPATVSRFFDDLPSDHQGVAASARRPADAGRPAGAVPSTRRPTCHIRARSW